MRQQSTQKQSMLLILGDQLFPPSYLQATGINRVFMAEDYGLCSTVLHHKQKISLFFCAMRSYAHKLQEQGFEVTYIELSQGSIFKKLRSELQESGIKNLHYFEIDDKPFKKEFDQEFKDIDCIEHPSPKFLVSKQEFKDYLASVKKPFMKSFYEQVRRRLNVLMEAGKPVGGKFSFDSENRKKLPKDVPIPTRHPLVSDQLTADVDAVVQKSFSKHPGSLNEFRWEYTRDAYLNKLDVFFKKMLPGFGPYQDAMSQRGPFLFHSLISPGLNMGLITPHDILTRIPKNPSSHKHLGSIEGFIRQVIGWREFVRGIYENYNERMEKENHWDHNRNLKFCWWDASTGLEPVDAVISKSLKYGYAHHIERLMIMANIFNLIEAKPSQVYQWFMEMYVDSADWVMQANVYGMGLMSEGGIFATKPYICGSNYLLKMSDFKRGPWCEILDGLYWRFIDKHRGFFSSNPRMGMMVRMFDKMPDEKKTKILKKADDFILSSTD